MAKICDGPFGKKNYFGANVPFQVEKLRDKLYLL